MRIVNIIGGLGNQMFQYAFAVTLMKKFPKEEVLLDTSHFHYLFLNKYKSANLHNGYELDKVFPNVTLSQATWLQLMKVTWYCPNFLLSRVVRRIFPKRKTEFVQPVDLYFKFSPAVYDIPGNVYYEGLWSSAEYYMPFKDLLKQVFSHPTPQGYNIRYIHEMDNTNSVGIHVRRGDYLLSPQFNGICGLDYYKNAIEVIISDKLPHIFYIFSNDIQWCKDNISPCLKDFKTIFVTENTGTNSCWDMHLMRHCKDLIIANSSFSWWAAFLKNWEGRVIAPKIWMNRTAIFDIWEDSWIRL